VPAQTGVGTGAYGRPAAAANNAAAAGGSPVARVSAALALGPSETGRSLAAGNARVQNALIQNFAPYLNQGGPIYGGASLIAFASGVSARDVTILRA
jgi:hypothetical protein